MSIASLHKTYQINNVPDNYLLGIPCPLFLAVKPQDEVVTSCADE
jgi:hypothetical protein